MYVRMWKIEGNDVDEYTGDWELARFSFDII